MKSTNIAQDNPPGITVRQTESLKTNIWSQRRLANKYFGATLSDVHEEDEFLRVVYCTVLSGRFYKWDLRGN